MTCSKCGHEVRAINTVHNPKENETYRAKRCLNCGHTFFTVEYEIIQNRRFEEDWAASQRAYRRNKIEKGVRDE